MTKYLLNIIIIHIKEKEKEDVDIIIDLGSAQLVLSLWLKYE